MSFEVANSWLVCNAIHVSNLFSDSFQYVANFSTPIHTSYCLVNGKDNNFF